MRAPFTATCILEENTHYTLRPYYTTIYIHFIREKETGAEVQQYIIIVLNALFFYKNILFEMLLKTLCRVFGGLLAKQNCV